MCFFQSLGGSSILLNSPIRFLESVCIMHFQTNVTTKRSYQAALGSSVIIQFSHIIRPSLRAPSLVWGAHYICHISFPFRLRAALMLLSITHFRLVLPSSFVMIFLCSESPHTTPDRLLARTLYGFAQLLNGFEKNSSSKGW